jgi:hypothetical protein
VETFGSFSRTHSLDVSHGLDDALSFGQSIDCRFQHFPELSPRELLLRRRRERCERHGAPFGRIHLAKLAETTAPPAAQRCFVNGDLCQPRRELCPSSELAQVLVSLRVRVLDDVRSFAAV